MMITETHLHTEMHTHNINSSNKMENVINVTNTSEINKQLTSKEGFAQFQCDISQYAAWVTVMFSHSNKDFTRFSAYGLMMCKDDITTIKEINYTYTTGIEM